MFIWRVFTRGYHYDHTFKTIKGLFLFGIIPIFAIIKKEAK